MYIIKILSDTWPGLGHNKSQDFTKVTFLHVCLFPFKFAGKRYNFSEIPSLFQNHTLGYITYPFGLIHFHEFRNGHRQTKSLGETVGTDCLDTK